MYQVEYIVNRFLETYKNNYNIPFTVSGKNLVELEDLKKKKVIVCNRVY